MTFWLILGAYLLGSISFGLVVVRRLHGMDVRSVGSGNPGATNALRAAGPAVGAAVLVLDLGKGMLPVMVGRELGVPEAGLAWIAAAAVVGHIYPIWHGFRGGKGVATAAGGLAALAPGPLLAAAVLFAVVVGSTRIVSLGSILTALSVPLWWLGGGRLDWWSSPSSGALAGCTAIGLLVIWRHRDNIRRLRRGEEPRLGGASRSGER